MKRREVFVDQDRMYALTCDSKGGLFKGKWGHIFRFSILGLFENLSMKYRFEVSANGESANGKGWGPMLGLISFGISGE